MTIFFTSDTHFGHANILKPDYENRPFASIEDMDEGLIARWNARVKTGDMIYHLGDFAFAKGTRIKELLDRLNGRKVFLVGNHDKELLKVFRNLYKHTMPRDVFTVEQYFEIKVGSQHIVLFHYPILSWNRRHHGSWHLHGHSHGNIPDDMNTRRIDVGVDSVGKYIGPHFDYAPMSLEEVATVMAARTGGAQVDHHDGARSSGN